MERHALTFPRKSFAVFPKFVCFPPDSSKRFDWRVRIVKGTVSVGRVVHAMAIQDVAMLGILIGAVVVVVGLAFRGTSFD